MKALLCLLLFAACNAFAGSSVINAEFTLYPDSVRLHDWRQCVWLDVVFDQGDGTHGVQCVSVPGQIVAITGTSTVKTDNEVLAIVSCGSITLWQGEQLRGTVVINLAGLADAGITGPCYVSIQSVGAYSRSGYEIQLLIFYR